MEQNLRAIERTLRSFGQDLFSFDNPHCLRLHLYIEVRVILNLRIVDFPNVIQVDFALRLAKRQSLQSAVALYRAREPCLGRIIMH